MSRTLTQYQSPPGRISLAGLTPDRLSALTSEEIERLPLAWGRQRLVLGDFFRIGGAASEELVMRGADPRFCEIGAGMNAGTLIVEGDAGDLLGRSMQGGVLIVHGNAGRFAACGLSGGELRIAGNVGDELGAPMPWMGAGMSGGRVIVSGNAGARCGDRLRRGDIFVAGNAGDFCGVRMVAGSIVVGGSVGAHAGHAMRRGSLFLLSDAFWPGATFVETLSCADAYLGLLWRDWSARFATGVFGDFARLALARVPTPRRWMGDLAGDGRGEVFTFAS